MVFAGLHLAVFLIAAFVVLLGIRRRRRKIDAFDPSGGDPVEPALLRVYAAPWTWRECLDFLRRRNVYDTMDYALIEGDGKTLRIAFNHDETVWRKQRLDTPSRWKADYLLRSEPAEGGAVCALEYAEAPLKRPLQNVDLDEFLLRKLDAKPTQTHR